MNITVRHGASWQGNVTITWPSPEAYDYDIVWIAKRSNADSDADAVFDKRKSNGDITLLDVETGVLQLQLDPVDYAPIDPAVDTVLVYGLYLADSNGMRDVLVSGRILVRSTAWRGN